MMSTENVVETDALVIGGGMSGLFAAIKAREEGVNVTLVDKGYVSRSGSTFLAGGAFAVFNPEWGHNLNEWMTQISTRGEYMNNPEWTEITVKDSYDRYKDFLSWGVEPLKGEDGELLKESRGILEARILGYGWTYLPVIRNHAMKSGVKIMDRIMITDLMRQDGRVIGAVGFHTRSGDFYIFKARATVMCTGSGGTFSGGFYFFDGEAMAYRAGAEIGGKEFSGGGSYIDAGSGFYSAKGDDDRISVKDWKIVPAGCWDGIGQHHIDKYVDAEGYKLNRHTFASAVHSGRGPILWNLGAATPEEKRNMLKETQRGWATFDLEGFDLNQGGLWRGIARFERYLGASVTGGGGGIASVDTKGATGLPGLYAAGDVYYSKAVGARYPSLGFGLRNASVTGAIAGRNAAEYALKAAKIVTDNEELARIKSSVYAPLERIGGFDSEWVTLQLKSILIPYYIWIVRHGERLKAVLTLVEFLKNYIAPKIYAKDAHRLRLAHETKNRILSAEMMLRSALLRTESRGTHYREDYPRRDDPNWLASVKLREKDGKMEAVKEPFPEKWWPDLLKPYNERYPLRFLGEE